MADQSVAQSALWSVETMAEKLAVVRAFELVAVMDHSKVGSKVDKMAGKMVVK
jgi:hypothetical protein